MRSFREICEVYLKTNGYLSKQEQQARSVNSRSRWGRMRKLNDQAHFVMMFAQLEDRINTLCKRLIDKRKRSNHWKRRRPWEILPNDMDRIAFRNRVALLVDRNSAAFKQIVDYYKDRCDIAHGNISSVRLIVMTATAPELQHLARSLEN